MKTNRNMTGRDRAGWLWMAALLLAGGGGAGAKPILTLEIASVDWRGRNGAGYDVFDPTPYSQTVTFTVSHRGTECAYFVAFSKNTPGNNPRLMASGGETIGYQLYDTPSLNNVLKDLPSASPAEVLSGAFGPGSKTHQLSFVLAMPAQQGKVAGTYVDAVQVSLYEGTLTEHTLAQSVVIQVTARVLPIADVSLVPPGGPFDPLATTQSLDFGPLADGKSLELDLRVRSNTGYTVSLQSDNGGALKSLEAGVADTVPYALDLGGRVVPLRTEPEVTLVRQSTVTTPNGDAYRLRVTIGPVGNASAGNYRDSVTITIRADN